MKKIFFWVSGPSLGCFWIVLRFWPKIFMKNACFLPKIEIGWDLGCFGKFHKILKIWHFLIMKNFFESGFLMSHGGSFPLGVKLHKCKKVYPKCVVAQRLDLLIKTMDLMLFFSKDRNGPWSSSIPRDTLEPLLFKVKVSYLRSFEKKCYKHLKNGKNLKKIQNFQNPNQVRTCITYHEVTISQCLNHLGHQYLI